MKTTLTALLIVLCSFATFSSSKNDALKTSLVKGVSPLQVFDNYSTFNFSKMDPLETSFVKDGFHVRVFYDNYYNRAILGVEVTIGGPGTPDFYAWFPGAASISYDGCFTGIINVEAPSGQVVLDVECNN
jgi:hypothetical protein